MVPVFCNLFERFVKNIARIAAPPNWKRQKDRPREFDILTAEEADAMQKLPHRMIPLQMLALLYAGGPFTLHEDACIALITRPYLELTRFTFRRDRDQFKKKPIFAGATGRLACWLLRLSGFEFSVVR